MDSIFFFPYYSKMYCVSLPQLRTFYPGEKCPIHFPEDKIEISPIVILCFEVNPRKFLIQVTNN